MKAVIILENGVVQNVYVDNKAAKVLVLDRDTDGCDDSSRLQAGNSVYGIDAMAQALPKVDGARVTGLFDKVQAGLKKRPREGDVNKVLTKLFDPGRPATDTLTEEVRNKIREVFSAIGIHRLDVEGESGSNDDGPSYVLRTEGSAFYGFLHYDDASGLWYVNNIETHTESKRGDPVSVEVTIGRGTDPLTACVEAAQHWANFLIQYAVARAVPNKGSA